MSRARSLTAVPAFATRLTVAATQVKSHHRITVIHQLQVTAVHLAASHHGHVTDDPSRAVPLSAARSYLRTADPVLARLIDERPDFDPRAWISQLPPMDLFGALLFQVAGQQLSVAATRRTIARVQDLFGGHLPAPAELLSVAPDQLRAAGFSWRKVSTLRDLAQRMSDGRRTWTY